MTPLRVYVPIALVLVLAFGIGALMVGLSNWLGPRRPSAVKETPFECGSLPVGSARERFGVKFYVVAILFIVFDLEIAFLFPWAAVLSALGLFGLVAMGIFLIVLTVGFVYEWKKGALEWD